MLSITWMLAGCNCLVWGEACHEVDELEASIVINKDCCCPVLLLGELSFELCNESDLGQGYLINQDKLPWLGCGEDFIGLLSFCMPWDFYHRSKQTTCTSWGYDFCQLLGDLTCLCQYLELVQWDVAEILVPLHQFCLGALGGIMMVLFLLFLSLRSRVKGEAAQWCWLLVFCPVVFAFPLLVFASRMDGTWTSWVSCHLGCIWCLDGLILFPHVTNLLLSCTQD